METEKGWEYKIPSELISPLSWKYVKAFSFYERGYLPNGNGWAREGNKLIEAISLIQKELSKIKKEEKDD